MTKAKIDKPAVLTPPAPAKEYTLYSGPTPKAQLVTIEVLLPMDEDAGDAEQSLATALDELRCYGSAYVVRRDLVLNTMDMASQILARRAVS